MSHAASRSRFLDGLAAAAGIDRQSLGHPGTTVVGEESRSGSGALACYRADRHLVIWCDPDVVDRVGHLADPEATLDTTTLGDRVASAGFRPFASVVTNLLADSPPSPVEPGGRYHHHWLSADRADHVEAIQAFVARCNPDDVEAAGLDEIADGYAETAINVLTPLDVDGVSPVAYASASDWFWDETFADIGVLVHGGHRGAGLGRFVAASTVERLLAAGRIPQWRHATDNHGSRAIAAGLGFQPVVTLDYFVEGPEHPQPDGGQ